MSNISGTKTWEDVTVKLASVELISDFKLAKDITLSAREVSGIYYDRFHVTTAICWPLGVAVVSVTCMRVRWVSHAWKYTQWNIFLFESSDKSPYWTNPYHIGFRYETPLNFYTYFGQCPNDIYILLHILCHVCPNYPHTGLATATAPSGHQMAIVVSRTV